MEYCLSGLRGSSCGKRINPNRYRVSKAKSKSHSPTNTSRLSSPQCCTKSALERNLSAKASSKKPKNTLAVVIHPPDFGKELSQEGKRAKSTKGKANESPKPAIPKVSCIAPPEESEPAKSEPKIGPVQENDTMAKVNAIKKMPMIPPTLEALSILFPHEAGKVIS